MEVPDNTPKLSYRRLDAAMTKPLLVYPDTWRQMLGGRLLDV